MTVVNSRGGMQVYRRSRHNHIKQSPTAIFWIPWSYQETLGINETIMSFFGDMIGNINFPVKKWLGKKQCVCAYKEWEMHSLMEVPR